MSSKRYPTGGNSLDLTRDANLKVIDKEIPGMAEAMRHQSMLITPHAI
jgi:molybdopterin biosynthesis enzyme MoaB